MWMAGPQHSSRDEWANRADDVLEVIGTTGCGGG